MNTCPLAAVRILLLSSACLSHLCGKRRPICSDVSHNHVDTSANSTSKATASLTLSIVTIVSPPYLSSDLPAYLRSALLKIMPLSGCCVARFDFHHLPLQAMHLPPRPRCILWKSFLSPLMTQHMVHIACAMFGVTASTTILLSQILARAAHYTRFPVRVGWVCSLNLSALPVWMMLIGFCQPFQSRGTKTNYSE